MSLFLWESGLGEYFGEGVLRWLAVIKGEIVSYYSVNKLNIIWKIKIVFRILRSIEEGDRVIGVRLVRV